MYHNFDGIMFDLTDDQKKLLFLSKNTGVK
jgi:hypothetical protein